MPLGAPESAEAVTVMLAVTESAAEFPDEEIVASACGVGTLDDGVACGAAVGGVTPPPPPPPQAARTQSNAKTANAR